MIKRVPSLWQITVVRHFTANEVFGKVSQQTRKVSQQTEKVWQHSGKVSQHRFAVKWQVTTDYLPSISVFFQWFFHNAMLLSCNESFLSCRSSFSDVKSPFSSFKRRILCNNFRIVISFVDIFFHFYSKFQVQICSSRKLSVQ